MNRPPSEVGLPSICSRRGDTAQSDGRGAASLHVSSTATAEAYAIAEVQVSIASLISTAQERGVPSDVPERLAELEAALTSGDESKVTLLQRFGDLAEKLQPFADAAARLTSIAAKVLGG